VRGHGGEPLGDQVVGPELAQVYDEIRRHAAGDTLLIHGESGSGKELAARLYHDAGPRSAGPFVAVNCAAIPEGVAERLLFGSKRGAFSGDKDTVAAALARANYVVRVAARVLGLHRTQLYRLMEKFGIARTDEA
jgi:transcriptional regulator with GAF, ATPase, and Fis domain